MYKVHCLNNISQKGLALLSSDYELTDDVSEADVILVRSANMHEMEFSDNLKAVARAGLTSGKVRRYVTDFATPEVMTMEGALVLPHLGASTAEAEENCAEMAVREVMDYLETGKKVHCVN